MPSRRILIRRPEHNFIANRFDIPGSNLNRMELFLQENHINFQNVTSFPEEAISPDGRFIARNDGIYLINKNQKIVGVTSLWLRGWTQDGTGAIYSSRYGGRCLLEWSLPFADDTYPSVSIMVGQLLAII